MGINDEKGNRMNEEHQPQDDSSNDDIPKWLQGLENSEHEESKPYTPKNNVMNSWVPEINEETTENKHVDRNKEEDEDDKEEEGPEEIKSPVEPIETDNQAEGTKDIETIEALDDEYTEEIEIDELPSVEYSDEIGPSLDDLPSSEGFMDISEMEVSGSPQQEEPILKDKDEALIEGELPEWLQEMIAEQEKSRPDDFEPDTNKEQELVDDPTSHQDASALDEIASEEIPADEDELVKDFDLVSDDEKVEDAGQDLEDDYFVDKELEIEVGNDVEDAMLTDEEDVSLSEPPSYIDKETAIAIADDATKPVVVSEDGPEIAPEEDATTGDEPTEEQHELAKMHLYQGDYHQAVPIIQELLEDSSHLVELETWVKEATEGEAKNIKEMWEILGDIYLKQNKPDQAFNAYAKAIKYLLAEKEVNDEIR